MTNEMVTDLNGNRRPLPDPTVLTTEALAREVAALKELLALRIKGEEDARMASDAAVAQESILRSALQDEKIKAIEVQLSTSDKQRIEQKADSKIAVDAAMQAAKEAVREQNTAFALSINKTENATNDQLRSLNATFTAAINGVERSVADLKDRIARGESLSAAQVGKGQGVQQSWGVLLGALGGATSIIVVIVLIATHTLH